MWGAGTTAAADAPAKKIRLLVFIDPPIPELFGS
jgi:hypothetical protein